MNKKQRQQIVSLLSMLAMAFIGFTIIGLMINWNLFIVIGCFIPILIIGLAIIIAPPYLQKTHKELSEKIDDGLTQVGKKVAKATK